VHERQGKRGGGATEQERERERKGGERACLSFSLSLSLWCPHCSPTVYKLMRHAVKTKRWTWSMRIIAKELVPFVELAARTGTGAMPENCMPAAVKYIYRRVFTQKKNTGCYLSFESLRFMRELA